MARGQARNAASTLNEAKIAALTLEVQHAAVLVAGLRHRLALAVGVRDEAHEVACRFEAVRPVLQRAWA